MTSEVDGNTFAAFFDENDDAEFIKMRKRQAARRFLWEAVLYFLFVVIFCISANQGRPKAAYDCAYVARQMFVNADYADPTTGRLMTLMNVSSIDDVYVWLSETFVPNAFPDESHFSQFSDISPYGKRHMFGFNYRLGTVRLRQLRVKAEVGCSVSRVAADLITSCWPEYTPEYEEVAAFGPPSNRSKYRFMTGDELCSDQADKYCKAIIFGRKSAAYSANGYAVDLPTNQADALAVVEELRNDRWLDYPSRVLIVDVSFFNPAARLFVALEVVIEFWPTGSVVVSHSTKPIPSMRLEGVSDFVFFGFELVLILFVTLYFIQEVREVVMYVRIPRTQCVKCVHDRILATGVATPMLCPGCNKREFYPLATPQCPLCHLEMSLNEHRCWRGYALDVWNWVDVVAQCLFIAIFTIRMMIRFDLGSIEFDRVKDGFLLLYPLAWQYIVVDWIYSVMSFILFAKLFKYLGRVRALASLVRTLSSAKMELLYFLIIFFTLFLGFAFAFYLAFGTDIYGYSSWTTAQIFLFQIVLGAIDYNALSRSNRLLAPAYLILYTLLVFFVLANVFIAIISGSHEEALRQLRRDRDDFLSSGLKLELNRLRLWFARLFGTESRATLLVSTFAKRLSASRQLTQTQRDNVRAFLKELEQDVYSQVGMEIIAHVVLSLTPERLEKPAEEYSQEDFTALANVVRDFKQFKKLEEDAARRGLTPAQFRWQSNDIVDRVLGPICYAQDIARAQTAASAGATSSAGALVESQSQSELLNSRSGVFSAGGDGSSRRVGSARKPALLAGRTATVNDVEVVLDDIQARQRVLEALRLLSEDLDASNVGPSDWIAPMGR